MTQAEYTKIMSDLSDRLYDALELLDNEGAHALLYLVSIRILERLYPEFLEKELQIIPDDFERLSREAVGRPFHDVFPSRFDGPSFRRELVLNLRRAVARGTNHVDIPEIIGMVDEYLVREGYPFEEVVSLFRQTLKEFDA
jgi:hypothetical protein